MKTENLGLISYPDALKYQEEKFAENLKKKQSGLPVENCLLFCEHPHVYTLGKSGSENNLLISPSFLAQINATFVKINRGGDITYHGPGQIVGYPHFDMDSFSIGTRRYVERIEEIIINVLADFSIFATQKKRDSGIWIAPETPSERKICAIGIKTAHRITMHGFALNVNTNLSYFEYINPCGHADAITTSMQKERGNELNIEEVRQVILEKFEKF